MLEVCEPGLKETEKNPMRYTERQTRSTHTCNTIGSCAGGFLLSEQSRSQTLKAANCCEKNWLGWIDVGKVNNVMESRTTLPHRWPFLQARLATGR